jgi:alcohol dehydrogenase YqhD (iron-dependent ADH family)
MMNEQKPLAAQMAAILELPPGASEANILATVTAWATERQQAQQSAAFEGRLATLMRVTNMVREQAVQCLAAQDAAARVTAKSV